MEEAKIIKKILNVHFHKHKRLYNYSDFSDSDYLLEIDVLRKNDEDNVRLNFYSKKLNNVAVTLAEEALSKILPIDIDEALLFVEEFDKSLKSKYNVPNYSSDFSEFIKGLRAYVLLLIDTSHSTYDYFVTRLNNDNSNRLKDFEESYFDFLLLSNYPLKLIYKSVIMASERHGKHAYYLFNFLYRLGSKQNIGFEVYDYGINQDLLSHKGFASHILRGIQFLDARKAFEMAVILLSKNKAEALQAIAGLDYCQDLSVEQVFKIVSPVEIYSVDEGNWKSVILCRIIQSPNSLETLHKKCFDLLIDLLKNKNQEIAHSVFNNVRYQIEGFEEDKYSLLFRYLDATKNFAVLNDFFYEFKNPKYLFDFLCKNFLANGFRGSLDQLDQSILHFFSESPEETEAAILDFFKYTDTGILGVRTMMCSFEHPLPIDILKLESEEYQNNALISICRFPHSLDKLVPTLLKFRRSTFKAVRENLQVALADMIFNNYHESLYTEIKKHLNPVKDKVFLNPLKKALDDYLQIKELKSIKEFDPRENEKNLMDLYYRFEHENQAKLMNSDPKSGLASLFKSVVIVRGKAWKVDGKEEVTPMARIEASMLVDGNAYVNPIEYERSLDIR